MANHDVARDSRLALGASGYANRLRWHQCDQVNTKRKLTGPVGLSPDMRHVLCVVISNALMRMSEGRWLSMNKMPVARVAEYYLFDFFALHRPGPALMEILTVLLCSSIVIYVLDLFDVI
ncbi:hypothetical protein BS50DRAFT_134556 [Corynespora cassiicola Philippines]|uniref:Uncharacterized protein n=1 Tax=Corynespora cassiicola Philippines TaxID=1448308 RepID=A0A2T2N997_CORCC|nr:hypothetical protein BS50DRAFT_134556 [Corynespora cassiicola Philippines]